jgi:Uri superfamily endonuclease
MLLEVYFTRAGSEIRNGTEMTIEPKPGTFALILSCGTNARIRIGRLGTMQLQCGYYVYLGSALGPGGLRARIGHHQKLSTRPHWHIDYLRVHTRFRSVWLSYDGKRHEHEWACAMQKVKGATIPFRGFGASDCSCPSHLYFFKGCPTQISFRAKYLFEAAADESLT